MAPKARQKEDTLIEAFFAQRKNFSFYKLIHLIENYYRSQAPIGSNTSAHDEVVRFAHNALLRFSVSDIEDIQLELKLTDQSFKSLKNEGFTEDILSELKHCASSFKLTDLSNDKLKVKGIPDSIIQQLKALANQIFTDENQFFKLIEKKIGPENTLKYYSVILNNVQIETNIFFEKKAFIDEIKGVIAVFKFLEQSFEQLKTDGLSDETLTKLKPLLNQTWVGERIFLEAIVKIIGLEETMKHKAIFLKNLRAADDEFGLRYESVILQNAQKRYVITSNFLGLLGSVTPLPIFYSEEIVQNEWETGIEDNVKKFMNVFHHCLISFIYRAWSKYRYHVKYELGAKDEISTRLFSLLGFGTDNMLNQLKFYPLYLLRYAGLLLQRPGSASGLKNIIADFLDGATVEITPCVGRRIDIDVEEKVKLGIKNCVLGESFTLGDSVFDRGGQFRVTIGPIGLKLYNSLLPTGYKRSELLELIHLYLTDRLDFEIELILTYDEIPEFQLSATYELALGWTTIMKAVNGQNMAILI
jgi:type VI secretion system protein ImpH